MEKPLQRHYWSFYWPLTLMGLAMLLSRQFQNGALARFPDAAKELAVFAFASSTFMLFNSSLWFLPQMANVLARSRRSRKICLKFIVTTCGALSVPLFLLAYTPLGGPVLGRIFGIGGEMLADVVHYLRYLAPLIFVNGFRFYCMGLLVQVKRTGYVTLLNVLYLCAVVGILVAGLNLGWGAVETLALAQAASACLHLAVGFVFVIRLYRPDDEVEPEFLTYRKTFDFFWPVAITAAMFALSRPVIYSFVNRVEGAILTVAVLRVAFDFVMIFHNPLNQIRHVFATFGLSDLPGVRRFMTSVMVGVIGLMALLLATPVGTWILRDLMGVSGELLSRSLESLWVLCLIPVVMTVRNYFHGVALARRRTGSMAAGGIGRVLAIALASWALYGFGWLNHLSAAGVLVLGFVAETAIVMFSPRPAPVAEEGEA